MKKLLAGIFTLAIVFGLAACTPEAPKEESSAMALSLADLKGKTVALFDVPFEKEVEKTFKEKHGIAEIVYTKTLLDGIMLVGSDKSDVCFVPTEATAAYLMKQYSDYTLVQEDFEMEFSMALAKSNTALLQELNSALETMDKDGSMQKLKETWVENFDVNAVKVEALPKIEGAETIKIGVSGDTVPFDYVTAAGEAAGFSVAVATEISRLLNKNIEFVIIPTETQYAAIEAGKIDVFFLHANINTMPEKFVATTSYVKGTPGYLFKK